MKKRMIRKGIVLGIIMLFVGASVISTTGNVLKENKQELLEGSYSWWDDDWHYRKQITIDHTKVADDLTDFPVLVHHISPDLEDHAQDDGDDITFISEDGTQLDHEIELYDDTSGELIAWVKIPSLSGSVDTILYMYYGNPDSSNQQNPEDVWDDQYVGVWHMNDFIASITLDSKYDNDGFKNTIQCLGRIGYGQRFDATRTNSIDCGNDPTLHGLCGTTEFTLECWVKTPMSESGRFFNKDDWDPDPGVNDKRGWYWALRDTTHKTTGYASEDNVGINYWIEYNWGTTINDGIWHYQTLKITWPGGSGLAYYIKDGNSPIPDTMGINFINPVVDTLDLEIGGNKYALEDGQHASLHGDMDECRISNIARSNAWLLTTYNTQRFPNTFMTFGPQEGTVLEIGEPITGGLFMVKAIVKNVGQRDASDVGWIITLNDGFIPVGRESSGTIANIPAGGEVPISSDIILGIGNVVITVEADLFPHTWDSKNAFAFVLLFLILMQ